MEEINECERCGKTKDIKEWFLDRNDGLREVDFPDPGCYIYLCMKLYAGFKYFGQTCLFFI